MPSTTASLVTQQSGLATTPPGSELDEEESENVDSTQNAGKNLWATSTRNLEPSQFVSGPSQSRSLPVDRMSNPRRSERTGARGVKPSKKKQ